MHAFQIEHLVQQRIEQRHAAADRNRLVSIARRARRAARTIEPLRSPDLRTGHLAHDLAALGTRAVELELARYARDARALGAASLPLALLSDTALPDVVRQRAFTHVVASVRRAVDTDRIAA